MNSNLCPNLNQFAASTAQAFLQEIDSITPDEPLYKVERRQMLAGMVQDELECFCEECMALEAIAAIVNEPDWSPRDPSSTEKFKVACDRYREARKKRQVQK
jgi:hypothetical protein